MSQWRQIVLSWQHRPVVSVYVNTRPEYFERMMYHLPVKELRMFVLPIYLKINFLDFFYRLYVMITFNIYCDAEISIFNAISKYL